MILKRICIYSGTMEKDLYVVESSPKLNLDGGQSDYLTL